MRTTVRLDDELLAAAKRLAIRRESTLTAVIEDALREAVERARSAEVAERVELPLSRGGKGLQPGVDLDDSAALLDLMDNAGAAP